MDGTWNAGIYREQTKQAELSKHRLLRINLSTTGLLYPGDASSYGALSPLNAGANVKDTGPHFVMSPITPANTETYGFEFALSIQGLDLSDAGTEPYTVTPWVLVGNSVKQDAAGTFAPIWAALSPTTVSNNQLFHSFDVDATAIRFQIVDAAGDQTALRSVIIAFSEV